MVVFDLLGEEVDFTPGQYFWVTLLDPPYEDDKGPRRHISVVTSPNDGGVLDLATRLRDSAFKRSLAELAVGADVEVEQPKGNFLLPEDASQPYVFIAGGIGIPPSSEACSGTSRRRVCRTGHPRVPRTATGSRFPRRAQELESAPEPAPRAHDDRRPGLGGRDRPHRRRDAPRPLDGELDAFTYLIAGPPPMVEAISGVLHEAGVPEDQVRPERFSGYRARGCGRAPPSSPPTPTTCWRRPRRRLAPVGLPVELLVRQRRRPCEERRPRGERARGRRVVDELAHERLHAPPSRRRRRCRPQGRCCAGGSRPRRARTEAPRPRSPSPARASPSGAWQ